MEEGKHKCPFSKNGCTTTFDKHDHLKSHEKKCLYQEDECPQCDLPVVRKFMVRHVEELCDMRTVVCGFCKEKCTFHDLYLHQETCPKKPISCEHCQQHMVYKDYDAHHETCCEKPHICELRDLGCEFHSNKEIIAVHGREIDAHFSLLCNNVRKVRDTTKELEANNSRLNEECERITIFMDSLKNEVEETRTNQIEYRSFMEKYKIRMKEFEKNYNTLTDYVDAIAKETNELKSTIFKINEHNSELKVENASLREEYIYHKSLILEIARKNDNTNDETSKFHKSMEVIEAEHKEINKEMERIKEFMVQLEAENHAINKFNSKFKGHIEEVSQDIKGMKEDHSKLKEFVDIILTENKDMKADNSRLKDYLEVISAENITMKDNNIKLKHFVDDLVEHFKELKEKFDINLKREKESWTESQIEIKTINNNFGSRMDDLEEKLNILLNVSKDEAIYLQVNRQTWLHDKTLEEVKDLLLKQLFTSPEKGKDYLVEIISGADIEEVMLERNLGLKTFANIQYEIKLKQGKSILTKDDRVVKLYVDQMKAEQEWPPERVDRVMWCLIDEATHKVLFYQIKEGRLGTTPQTGLQYKVFGWFFVNKEQLQHLKLKSTNKRLQSAFLIYKNPT